MMSKKMEVIDWLLFHPEVLLSVVNHNNLLSKQCRVVTLRRAGVRARKEMEGAFSGSYT